METPEHNGVKEDIQDSTGAVVVDGKHPYVFVLTTQGNLWVKCGGGRSPARKSTTDGVSPV